MAMSSSGGGPASEARSGGGRLPPAVDGSADATDLLSRLAVVAEQIGGVAFDGLADGELEHLLDGLRGPIARLEATRASGFAALERRAARQAPAGGASAAELEQRRRNARRQRLSPSVAKRAAEAGRVAADHAAIGEAFRSGDLGTEHARVIGELLRRIPPPLRGDLERRLIDLAGDLDPITFGRRARDLVARAAPEAAAYTEQLAANRRSFRAADTPDGGFAFSGLLYGTAAETARTAFQAFRRPDTPDEHRTHEQAGADAFEQLCEAALRGGDAPTDHGVRPHVIVVVEEADLGEPAGVARLAHSAQTVTAGSIGHLLDDCSLSRLVRDAPGTPLEASEAVRTVPAGLWRALLVRDGGCTWDGCDAPASWCDVAHGHHAFTDGGRLSPSNAALLCRRHHRRFDSGPYRLRITGDRVHYERDVSRVPHSATRPGRSEPMTASVVRIGRQTTPIPSAPPTAPSTWARSTRGAAAPSARAAPAAPIPGARSTEAPAWPGTGSDRVRGSAPSVGPRHRPTRDRRSSDRAGAKGAFDGVPGLRGPDPP